ncbi:MAG TPA: hypothetical protein ENI96_01045 [Sedimenticola thiotaurini]|uniref:Uncharacterized protein n=1 Tax=Sedimenticola thiotaurini TaxID=1543721 RepID=A0A831W1Y6_9GAMM|nr:hypothetical protein [Sedimenticola thiotaurini]
MNNSYSPDQSAQIRAAIEAGRRALSIGERSPRVFAAAYLRAGGLQQPGGELDPETRRRVEGRIMAIINQRGGRSREPAPIQAMIEREVARIYDEFDRFQTSTHPDLTGYRLRIGRDVADPAACHRFARIDLFGMGPGVIPPNEIVVLPPCCDGAVWEPVYQA